MEGGRGPLPRAGPKLKGVVVIKRMTILLSLMIILVLLSACGGAERDREEFSAWREEFRALEELTITADLTAAGGTMFSEYRLLYRMDGEEETVEVIAPELIANIKARRSPGALRLSYDGVMLDTGHSAGDRLSPMMALPTFADCLRDGHIERTWREEVEKRPMLVTELQLPDGVFMTLWQERGGMRPVHAALRNGEAVTLRMTVIEWGQGR